MKTNKCHTCNLFEGGRDELESTSEYKRKVGEIIKETTDEYSPALSSQRNWLRRLLIKGKLNIEIRKRIQALSSLKNLHISAC